MQNFNFSFTEKELNTILQCLGDAPAKISMPVIVKIQNEAQKQLQRQKEQETIPPNLKREELEENEGFTKD